MKKAFACFLMGIVVLVNVSCSKSGDKKDGNFGNNPRTEVPDDLTGYWLTGSTSIGNFWGYDGSYQGAAYELAIGYMLYKDGRAKQYFYYTSTSYYCRTQVLGYKEGTVEVDMNRKTFTFYPASGNYRNYNTCGSSGGSDNGKTQSYGNDELYPAMKVDYKDVDFKKENGVIKSWHIYYSDGSSLNFVKSEEPKK